jgi:transposase-like protein
MENELTIPKTLKEAILYYADEDRCLELLMAARWPDGVVVCPYCQGTNIGFVRSRRLFQCKGCRKQYSIKVGTYMEDSPLPLSTWLPAMWLLTNAKNGISSHEVARALGVTQKTAWFMMHRVRLSFGDTDHEDMSGTVEADETYIGGLEKNKHKAKKLNAGRGSVGKECVMAILERGDSNRKSRVAVNVIPSADAATLRTKITENVSEGTAVYTDGWKGYKGLPEAYIHDYVDHAIEYVRDNVHTNGLENFFSLVKRMVKGTYVQVSPWHLERYMAEQTFRFNERGTDDAGRFVQTVAGVHGKRITWKELTFPQWASEAATEGAR